MLRSLARQIPFRFISTGNKAAEESLFPSRFAPGVVARGL